MAVLANLNRKIPSSVNHGHQQGALSPKDKFITTGLKLQTVFKNDSFLSRL